MLHYFSLSALSGSAQARLTLYTNVKLSFTTLSKDHYSIFGNGSNIIKYNIQYYALHNKDYGKYI